MKELQEYCIEFIVPQRDKPKEFGGSIPWCRIEDIQGKYLNGTTSGQYVTDETIKKMNLKVIPKGAVICSCSASLGVQAILTTPCVTNQTFIGIVPKEELDSEFLYYMLKSKTAYFKKIGTGTTIPYISRKKFEQLLVPELSLAEQSQVVEVLRRAECVIDARKKELKQLDDLIKARFVEMFGDYHTNSKNFESHKGGELFKFSSGKFLPEEKRFEEGIPVYGGNGIAWYTDKALIDYPTIIIGRVGAWCGNIHTVSEPVWITDNAIFIKEQYTDKFTLEFLTEMMKIMDFHQYADFSGQPKITQKPLETLEYLTPPIEMQNEFTEFCKQVDKSKFI